MEMIVFREFNSLDITTFYSIIQLRERVFHLEQRITDVDLDGVDFKATYGMLFVDNDLAGVIRITSYPTKKKDGTEYREVHFSRFCLDKNQRGKKLGQKLFDAALDYSWSMLSGDLITLEAQAYLIPFYEKFKFIKIGGLFTDAGILHQNMELWRI